MLLPHHQKEMYASGLTDAQIEGCGFYSEDRYAALSILLGRKVPRKLAPAWVVPYKNPDGQNGYARVKPDNPRKLKGKPVKYESPVGRQNEVFTPPGTFRALSDPTVELSITEGEKKSARLDQEGWPTLGLVGVYGWKNSKAERLLPVLDAIAWQGREVRIVFDSDITSNPNVQDAENRLAAQLVSRGAKVRCVRLPDAADGGRLGVDDFLQVASIGDLRKLYDEAIEPEPVDAGEIKIEANQLDPATEVARLLDLNRLDSTPRLAFWRGCFYWWMVGAYREKDVGTIRGELVRYLNRQSRHLTSSVVANMMQQLQAQAMIAYETEPPAWLGDLKPWPTEELLVAKNGIFHLPSAIEGKEHRVPLTPKLFTTTALDFDVALDAPKPEQWFRFLSELWPNDPQSIDTLQEWFGYLLTTDTSQHKILFLVGPKRSGKGTVARVARALIGPANVAGPTLALLGTNFGLWPLIDKSLAIVPDARLSGRSDRAIVVERLLSISGEDALTIDRKNQQPITVQLPTRLMLISNELPRLSDASGALASRMILLKLSRSWFGKEDIGLTGRLLTELPGILLWAIGGWRRLRQRGRFVQPESATQLVAELAELGSPVSAFVENCCEIEPEASVARRDLYQVYTDWCKQQGRHTPEDQAGFGRSLHAAFPDVGDSHPRIGGRKIRHYTGIRVGADW